jgi:hypothetical protein
MTASVGKTQVGVWIFPNTQNLEFLKLSRTRLCDEAESDPHLGVQRRPGCICRLHLVVVNLVGHRGCYHH